MAQQKFSVAIKSDTYRNLINETLGNPQVAQKFVAEISTLVAQNYALQECEAGTILSAGLLAQTLNLPLAPTLGFAYIIPYGKKATFQAGWKAFIQLAIRTGQYKRIGVRPVHKGEWIGQDKYGDDLFEFNHQYDDNEIIGYYAYFELVNGFEKTLYWTKEQCQKHGLRYSQEYKNKGTGKWVEMFDEMAQKTVIKQLISKWGIMSTELQTMVQADQSVIRGDGNYEYVDNVDDDTPKPQITNTLLPKEE